MFLNFLATLDNTRRLPNQPAVYMLVCTIDGRRYVGATKTLRVRMSEHRSYSKKSTSDLHLAMQQHGFASFAVAILETCTVEELEAAELDWISKLQPEFNGVVVGPKGVTMSKSTREKMAASARTRPPVSDATRELKRQQSLGNQHRRGIPHTAETCARISQGLKGNQWNVGKTVPEDVRRKKSEKMKARGHQPSREAIEKAARNRTGVPMKQETRDKIAASHRAFHAAKRAARALEQGSANP